MSEAIDDDADRSRRVQALTCPCCTVTHADIATLRAHLISMKGKIDTKLRQIEPKSAA